MHEAKAMRDVVETVLDRARRAGGMRVLRVELALGPAGHLTEAVARQHFAALAAGTIAAGAALAITAIPGTYQCIACGRHFSSRRQDEDLVCPDCGGQALATPGQDGCYLNAIEVVCEVDKPACSGTEASSGGGGHVPE
jgi:Zn finger protein HypA/HybF involved in hydrogenase expression